MTRAVCDSCESAPAVLFCAADEAALCEACDQQVHGCNKLASKHIRLVLKESRDVPKCDICENAPAFFFCGIDGTSLCLQCDMDAHVGGKRTHERYILIKQKVELLSTRKEAIDTRNEDHQKSPFFGPSYADNNPQKDIVQRNMEQCNMPNVRALHSCEEDQPQGYWRVSPSAIDLNCNPTSFPGEPSDHPMSSQTGEHSFNQEGEELEEEKVGEKDVEREEWENEEEVEKEEKKDVKGEEEEKGCEIGGNGELDTKEGWLEEGFEKEE